MTTKQPILTRHNSHLYFITEHSLSAPILQMVITQLKTFIKANIVKNKKGDE